MIHRDTILEQKVEREREREREEREREGAWEKIGEMVVIAYYIFHLFASKM